MVVERARRLVEHGRDDHHFIETSITRLARAYNIVVPAKRTYSIRWYGPGGASYAEAFLWSSPQYA